jgi:tRNA modification GTPase
MASTIFALSSAPGRAGVAVIRLSGPAAGSALSALTGRPLPPARQATLAALVDPRSDDLLDRALVLHFPGPASFTGEDVVELHVHGGRAVVDSVFDALAAMPGLRPAEPGEFTRRAFENGKLDLTEAEGIADLVDAETRAQQRQALRQMDGALGRLYDGWRARLSRALAHIEADLDFPDEDLPEGVAEQVRPELALLIAEIGRHLDDNRRGERLRSGVQIAILGPPNAGKSSLLNALARRDAAIVSERAGTTRDVIEVHLDLGGYPVIVADTAGLRQASDEIEDEGIRRARARAEQADVKILLFDALDWPELDPEVTGLADGDSLTVLNKVDLRPDLDLPEGFIGVSVRTGEGMGGLLGRLEELVADRLGGSGAPSLTRLRHRQALEECREALLRAEGAPLPELVAEDVRLALRALGRITGKVDVEDLLDIVFRDFCIGK